MLNEKELPFLAEKGHIVSLVGGGGKTTLLYAMAAHCARKGWRVLVTTTTHIRQPAARYAPDDAALTALWQAGHYAVIGTPAENGKLTLPPQQLLRRMAQADAMFIEADGAKHHSLKYPAADEPVIYPGTTDVIIVLGTWEKGRSCKDVVFRYELMQKELGTAEDAVVDDSVIDTLRQVYVRKLRDSGFEGRVSCVFANERGG